MFAVIYQNKSDGYFYKWTDEAEMYFNITNLNRVWSHGSHQIICEV